MRMRRRGLCCGGRAVTRALAELGFADPADSRGRFALDATRGVVQTCRRRARAPGSASCPCCCAPAPRREDPDLALARALPLVSRRGPAQRLPAAADRESAGARRPRALCAAPAPGSPSSSPAARRCSMSCSIAPACTRRRSATACRRSCASSWRAWRRMTWRAHGSAALLQGFAGAARGGQRAGRRLPLMKVSDKLSFIAEVCLSRCWPWPGRS
jgi:hypothetical protein